MLTLRSCQFFVLRTPAHPEGRLWITLAQIESAEMNETRVLAKMHFVSKTPWELRAITTSFRPRCTVVDGMDSTNINDLEGIKALLEQLRGSQAWQDLSQPLNTEGELLQAQEGSPGQDHEQGIASGASTTIPPVPGLGSSTSVASLLAQLQSHPTPQTREPDAISTPRLYSGHPIPRPSNAHPPTSERHPPPTLVSLPGFTQVPQNAIAPLAPSQDLRHFTFQQTLPVLSNLAENPQFLSAVNLMKKEQDDLERRLWQDRRDIYRKYEDKVKVALTKATLVGDSGLSKHEAEMLQVGLKKELEKFDRERVLVAWDGLITKHQNSLAHLGVPTMFATESPFECEKQQKVIHVLEGFL